MENSQIMREAYNSLKNNWGNSIVAVIIYLLAMILPAVFSGLFISVDGEAGQILYVLFFICIFYFYFPIMTIGLPCFALNISRGKQANISDLFIGFDNGNAWTIIYSILLLGTAVLIHLYLFLIPGIIVALALSQIYFILVDNPKASTADVLYKSVKIMSGYKFKLFKINIRIFLLTLLCIPTLGIGLLFLIPYQYVVYAKFYDDIKDKPSFKNQEYLS